MRYTPVKLLADIAQESSVGGLKGWLSNFPEEQHQVNQCLLPSISELKPIKPRPLKKLVLAKFDALFSPQVRDFGDGIYQYVGHINDADVSVTADFGRPLHPTQLHYGVSVNSSTPSTIEVGGGFEWLMGAGVGMWDFLTEENADRSIDLLCELIQYMVQLPGRFEGI